MDDIDISYTKPDEEIAAPSNEYTKIMLPFVGIYNSILNANIEDAIERELDWFKENSIPCEKVVVDLKAIYRSIAEYTAKKLGFKTAVYAGANSPAYYNYRDDYIFVWVKRNELEALYKEHGLDREKDDIDNLCIALAKANKDLHVENGEYPLYSVALAVYDDWYDSDGQWGYETIDENTKYSRNGEDD